MEQYFTIKTFVERHRSFLTEASLRNLIARAEPRKGAKGKIIPGNGLDIALIRRGRRIYIHEVRFMGWLEGNKQEQSRD